MAESKLRTLFVNQEEIKELYNQCGTIRRILIASINTAKNNTEKKNAL